jgi:glutathionyl-hydroquinone reductase
MGQLVDGQWRTENILVNHDDKGLYFKRPSIFRSTIGGEAQSVFSAAAAIIFIAPSPAHGRIVPR